MGTAVTVADYSRDPDALIARAGVRGDPNQDQHFLVDDRVLDRIVEYGLDLPGPFESVLEVGAGTGALTGRLIDAGASVHAVELDRQLVGFLQTEFTDAIDDGRLVIHQGDALDIDLPSVDAVVANLPYSAASEIIFRLLPEGIPMVVMVQREFAERLTAEVGTPEYGRLTVSSWWYADAEPLETVPSAAFDPAPPVESALVRFSPVEPRADIDGGQFNLIVKAIFTQRRKTLRNAIRNTTHISHIEDASAVIDRLDETLLSKRPDAVSPIEYVDIVTTALDSEAD